MKNLSCINLLNSIAYSISRSNKVIIVTLVKDGGIVEKALFSESAELTSGSIDEGCVEAVRRILPLLLREQSRLFVESIQGAGGQLHNVIVEVLYSRQRMLVFGAGHVGQAVAQIGRLAGYAVTVYDDREEFLDRRLFPDTGIDLCYCDFSRLTDDLGELKGAIIVIVTRGHQYDEECLKSVVDSAASYIGMIGSRRRVISIFKQLEDKGVEKINLEKVRAPIGLDIGAVTPQEIAVAIVAEVIQELNGKGRKGMNHGI